MPARYLIEVPHEDSLVACARTVDFFKKTGSHYLSHADWGCKDREHKSWMIVEADSKEEARAIVPVAYRPQAKVVRLNSFTDQEIEDILHHHKTSAERSKGAAS